MKRVFAFVAVTGLSILALPAALLGSPPAAPTGTDSLREELIVGAYQHEHEAHAEARRLRERGWTCEVFHGHGPRGHGWYVKAFKG